MKNLYCILLLAFSLNSLNLKSQLSGNAFLNGQTNHSGITVKFTSQGGTAVTDSTTTTSTGSYSINITGGVYKVSFSKVGYITSNYNNAATTLLTNTVVLSNDTLLPGNQVFVSGNVCGNWTSNNTYIVTGSITIPISCTLTIQPGTVIKFNSNDTLTANGTLIASGTAANPILFTSNIVPAAIGNWSSIQINNSSSIIDNCIIEYAEFGVFSMSFSPIISNNIIRNAIMGIYSGYGSPHIFNNEVYNCINSSNNSAIGIWATGSNATVECNHVYNCQSFGWNGYGIITYANLVQNNIVHDITGGVATGIQIRGSNSQTENNYIYNCGTGISISNSTITPSPVIYNNTINNCSYTGILIDDNGGNANNPSLINNIITNSNYGVSQGASTPTSYNISYNLVWNSTSANYNNVQVTGVGTIVSTNAQGNPIDSYYNMSQDPLFVSGLYPALSSGSPCLNAGNSTYSSNIGFDTSYACQNSLNSIPSYNKQNTFINIYPNPTNGTFKIESNTADKLKVDLYDVNGRHVFNTYVVGTVDIDANSLGNGIYTMTIKNNIGIVYKKLVIAR